MRNRDYDREYATYHAKPEQKKNRAMRNAARQKMLKLGRVSKGDTKEVNHKKPIRTGGDNAPANLEITSRSKNRAWRKGKS
jgi:5-methylcytosine-specific restriction endonuclease McrA